MRKIISFWRDEDGLALTEYLIVLGLLTGAVIGAVVLFGGALGSNWHSAASAWQAGNFAPAGTELGADGPSGGEPTLTEDDNEKKDNEKKDKKDKKD